MPLIAQADVALQGWVALIVQTGAIGILGYHLLINLPRMVKDLNAAQAALISNVVQMFRETLSEDRKAHNERASEDRKAFTDRNAAIITELKGLQESLPRELATRIEVMVNELHQQTGSLERMAKKIEEWPSDVDKFCRVEQALKAAGFDEKVVKRLIALKRREQQ